MRTLRQWSRLPQDFVLFLSLEKARLTGPDCEQPGLTPELVLTWWGVHRDLLRSLPASVIP